MYNNVSLIDINLGSSKGPDPPKNDKSIGINGAKVIASLKNVNLAKVNNNIIKMKVINMTSLNLNHFHHVRYIMPAISDINGPRDMVINTQNIKNKIAHKYKYLNLPAEFFLKYSPTKISGTNNAP